MNSMIDASVRQVSSTWDDIATVQHQSHSAALSLTIMQAEIHPSDPGVVDASAQPHLAGARTAIDGVQQGCALITTLKREVKPCRVQQ